MNWADSDWVCKAKPLLIEGLLVWEELGSLGDWQGTINGFLNSVDFQFSLPSEVTPVSGFGLGVSPPTSPCTMDTGTTLKA